MRKHLLGTTALIAAGLAGLTTLGQEPVTITIRGYGYQFFPWSFR